MNDINTMMWMEWLWCVLQFVGPMFLRYYPFRNKLKISIGMLGGIVAFVWLGIAFSLMIFGYSKDYSMNIYCSVAILIFFPLSCAIIKDRFVKHFFVYLMSYNLMTVSIGISQFAMQRFGGGLLIANIATILFYLVTYPFIFRFLSRNLEPVMDVEDEKVWKIAWVPMMLFYLTILVATPGMLNAQEVSYVLTRTLLGLCCAAFCIILVICLRYSREHTRKEEALHQVQHIADMKEEFLHDFSHELQMPITVISGFAQLTQQMMEDEQIERTAICRNMQRIDNEAMRMERLVSQMLDDAAIENGSFSLNYQMVDMANLIHTAESVYFPVMNQNGNTLSVKIEAKLPLLYGDPTRLLQVIINLISNAIKHTEHGMIILSANVDGDDITVSVKDNGAGIDAKLLPHLFERYPHNRSQGGNGLGLYICKKIVDAHNGCIEVESKREEGTTVCFRIPMKKGADS